VGGEAVTTTRRGKATNTLAALAFLLTAWGVDAIAHSSASQLDLRRFGGCEDVCEALARDSYVARFLLPYVTAALLLDGLAGLFLLAATANGNLGIRGVLLTVLWVPTVAYHGLGWIVSFVFAA
jgi:hypothetical protein